jgi:hypothetical protein
MLKKIVSVIITLIFVFGFLPQGVGAVSTPEAGASAKITPSLESAEVLDSRTVRLAEFLLAKNSPLAEFAADFVNSADQFSVDWRLLPAISGLESGFGKAIQPDSYNAYGWGNGRIIFTDWPDSINKVTLALAQKYYQQGLDTPEKIGPVYAPPCFDWAPRINFIMAQIEEFVPSPQPEF